MRALLDEDRSPLPHAADLERIGAWAIDAQRRRWRGTCGGNFVPGPIRPAALLAKDPPSDERVLQPGLHRS